MHDPVLMENGDRERKLPEVFADAVVVDLADASRSFLTAPAQCLIAVERLRRRLPRFEQRILQLRDGEIFEQLGTADELHRQCPFVADDEELIEAGEVRMAQLGEIAKLAFESRDGIRHRALEHLQRDDAVAIAIERLVDDSERTGTESRNDLEAIVHVTLELSHFGLPRLAAAVRAAAEPPHSRP